jgi:hypothetical protein
MEPLELLKQELEKWEKALRKSEDFLKKNMITIEEHETHKKNLTPKIQSYKHAIDTIEIFEKLAKHFG